MSKNKIRTLEELEKLNTEFKESLNKAEAEVESNKAELDSIAPALVEAAKLGNVEEYKRLYAHRGELETNIAALVAINKQVKAMHACGFTDDEVLESFAEHIAPFNVRVEKYNAQIEKIRKDFAELYIAMAEDQNRQLEIRNRYDELLSDVRSAKYASGHFSLNLALNSKMKRVPSSDQINGGNGLFGPLSLFDYDTAKWLNMVCDADSAYPRP